MKKYSWIVALLIALSLAFIGCPGDSGGGGDDPNDPNNPNNPNNPNGGATIVKELKLVANGYGDGFQCKINLDDQIMEDDEFALKMTFTIDRDVLKVGTGTGNIGIGLVDTDASVNYWDSLSWSDAADIKMFYTEDDLVAGEEYTVETTLKALKDSSGAGGDRNVLIFQTEHEFTPANSGGNDNSGVAPLTIKCTVYEFAKVED